MVGEKNAKEAVDSLDDSEFSGTHIQVQVRWFKYSVLQADTFGIKCSCLIMGGVCLQEVEKLKKISTGG